jgi:prepilin-type N-terminal cleavage/methylation domain-containing protein
MKLNVQAGRRAAFSLIELLVVIAIIAILCALLAAAIMKMLALPPQKNTQLLIQKLAASLEQQYKATVDQCKSEAPLQPAWNACLAGAGGDGQKALNSYIQLRLAQEFPTTFGEALAPPGGLPPRPYYLALQGVPPPPPTKYGNSFESGICLYIGMTVARRGMEFDPGSLAPKEARPVIGVDIKAFFDGWDEPLAYERYVDPAGNMKFRIKSAGANHRFGDADDVNSDNLRLGK